MQKLTQNQLSGLVHNVLSHHFDAEGRLHFSRFTPTQLKTYEAEDPHWVVRAKASASVTLELETDSSFLALQFDLYPGSSQAWGSVDLYVDGVFYQSRRLGDLGVKVAGFPLPEGEHRVTVYFPWSAETVVSAVLLSDGASCRPVEKRYRLLVLGDSITQGYTSNFASLTYVNQVARMLDAEVVNQGIGGYYCNKKTLASDLGAYRPDVVMAAYGTNDYSRYDDREEFIQNTGDYIRSLSRLFPDALLVGLLPIYRNDDNHRSRTTYREYTLDEGRAILRSHYEGCPNSFVIEETGIARLPAMYIADQLHPNELGFTLMAQGIARQLAPLLNR